VPSGPKEGAKAIGAELADKLPTTSEQGWRGESLVRLRIPLPPEPTEAADPTGARPDRLSTQVMQALGDALKAMSDHANSGQVVHVVALDDAFTGEVLRVGRFVQENGSTGGKLSDIDSIWPGARCRGADCGSAVAVFFSKAGLPNTRGLTAKPEKGRKPVAEKPEPGPAPSAAFCNEADIKVQMARKTAAFRFCYERELQLEKDIEGRVTMNFVIALSGATRSVRVANNALGSAKVADCLSREIAKMQFKAPDGGECVVQWPFNFRKN